MLELAILGAVAGAGYLGAPAWWVLPAAAAMTIAGWWRKVALLRQHPQVPFSTKMTTYLLVSVGVNLGFATANLLLGRAARLLLQG
jgi:hypothetical protein